MFLCRDYLLLVICIFFSFFSVAAATAEERWFVCTEGKTIIVCKDPSSSFRIVPWGRGEGIERLIVLVVFFYSIVIVCLNKNDIFKAVEI